MQTRGAPRKALTIGLKATLTLTALLLGWSTCALAQDQSNEEPTTSSSILMEEVTVTARKREESIQQVPVSVSAYSGDQIETLKVRDLKGLSIAMPNVLSV